MTKPVEAMKNFFDARVDSYDEHMLKNVEATKVIYEIVANQVISASASRMIDFGCGTGLELQFLFEKVPGALITGIDLSEAMLEHLRNKYRGREEQLELIAGSYLDLPLAENYYDYAVSVMSLHHFLRSEKLSFYRKVLSCLMPGGKYIEGDYTVPTMDEENRFLVNSIEIRKLNNLPKGLYHIDIPFTPETQIGLLQAAGFQQVELVWTSDAASVIVGVK